MPLPTVLHAAVAGGEVLPSLLGNNNDHQKRNRQHYYYIQTNAIVGNLWRTTRNGSSIASSFEMARTLQNTGHAILCVHFDSRANICFDKLLHIFLVDCPRSKKFWCERDCYNATEEGLSEATIPQCFSLKHLSSNAGIDPSYYVMSCYKRRLYEHLCYPD